MCLLLCRFFVIIFLSSTAQMIVRLQLYLHCLSFYRPCLGMSSSADYILPALKYHLLTAVSSAG